MPDLNEQLTEEEMDAMVKEINVPEVETAKADSIEREAEQKTEETPEEESVDYKAKWEKSEAAFKSASGQVNPVMRQNETLRREVESLKQKLDAPKSEQPKSEKWDAFEEEFPEDAAPHKERYERIESENKELNDRLNRVETDSASNAEQIERERYNSEAARLNEMHPDFYGEIQGSAEYAEFLEKLPVGVASLVKSTNADDYNVLLNLFKADRKTVDDKPADKVEETAPDVESQVQAQKIKQQRQRVLSDQSPASGSSRGGGSVAASSGRELLDSAPEGLTQDEAVQWLVDNDPETREMLRLG